MHPYLKGDCTQKITSDVFGNSEFIQENMKNKKNEGQNLFSFSSYRLLSFSIVTSFSLYKFTVLDG